MKKDFSSYCISIVIQIIKEKKINTATSTNTSMAAAILFSSKASSNKVIDVVFPSVASVSSSIGLSPFVYECLRKISKMLPAIIQDVHDIKCSTFRIALPKFNLPISDSPKETSYRKSFQWPSLVQIKFFTLPLKNSLQILSINYTH